jgi:hypothetical protein
VVRIELRADSGFAVPALYNVYVDRGEPELWIKDFKRACFADRIDRRRQFDGAKARNFENPRACIHHMDRYARLPRVSQARFQGAIAASSAPTGRRT